MNTLRDHYRSLKEMRLKREYEEKVSQINPSADLGIALNWYARKMRGEVAGSISFKKFMKLKNESGIRLNNGMKYYLYQALIANKTLRLPYLGFFNIDPISSSTYQSHLLHHT